MANLGDIIPEVVTTETDRGYFIPVSLAQKTGDQALLSNTSDAWTCFTNQSFSRTLQMFLVTYVITTSGYYSIYGK